MGGSAHFYVQKLGQAHLNRLARARVRPANRYVMAFSARIPPEQRKQIILGTLIEMEPTRVTERHKNHTMNGGHNGVKY